MAIGAAVASGPYLALSLLIGIQNISEGIASYREMMTGKTAFSDNPNKAFVATGIILIMTDIKKELLVRFRWFWCWYPRIISYIKEVLLLQITE